MDLTKMSEVELKALWLDQLLIIENTQKNIQAIQSEISRKKKEVSTEK